MRLRGEREEGGEEENTGGGVGIGERLTFLRFLMLAGVVKRTEEEAAGDWDSEGQGAEEGKVEGESEEEEDGDGDGDGEEEFMRLRALVEEERKRSMGSGRTK